MHPKVKNGCPEHHCFVYFVRWVKLNFQACRFGSMLTRYREADGVAGGGAALPQGQSWALCRSLAGRIVPKLPLGGDQHTYHQPH